MNKKSYLCIIILLAVSLCLSWLYFLRRPIPEAETKIEIVRDTIREWYPVPKIVKVKDYQFIEIPRDSIIEIYKRDTVALPIPIEERTYQDSTYLVKISGFRPSLDYIETYQTTKTVTNTIYKKPIISFGPSLSVGFDPISKTLNPTIGISVVIPIWSYYLK